ncbi:MAG: CHY zinc finger protein [Gammaproteobacteria bacterium]|nr:CHY zinc finger protein [Gammaproteobacteria bacterium]
MTQHVVRSFGVDINGIRVDQKTGCVHYRSELDVIAIRHHCCGEWYACIECHAELADHDAAVWPQRDFDVLAVFCGVCGNQSTISAYLAHPERCAACGAPFNPGCSNHHHLYFEK